VDQLDEARLIGEGRREGMPAAALENEARLRAVDSHLFHVGIREVLGQRAERRDRGKDPAP